MSGVASPPFGKLLQIHKQFRVRIAEIRILLVSARRLARWVYILTTFRVAMRIERSGLQAAQRGCLIDWEKWSGRVDLNHRPPGPEPGALARLRYAPTDYYGVTTVYVGLPPAATSTRLFPSNFCWQTAAR